MSGRVIVVGSVNIDLVARVPHLPHPGETVTGGSYERHHGGKGGNQAVAAARLRRPTLFIGAVGDDTFEQEARRALSSERVDVSMVASLSGQPTGVALILVDATGENEIAVVPGANGAIEAGYVRECMARLGPLVGDVMLVCNEVPLYVVREALLCGQAAGATTILNPAPAIGIDRAIFGLADIVTPNRNELATLLQTEATRTGRRVDVSTEAAVRARSLLEPGPDGPGVRKAVIVTLGAAGVVVLERTGTGLSATDGPNRVPDGAAGADGAAPAAGPGLAFEDLRVAEAGVPRLRGVSLAIAPGEIVGVAGVDGNGQKELAECLLGIRRADRGGIRLHGQAADGWPTALRRRRGLAFISDDRHQDGLVLDLDLAENYLLGFHDRPGWTRHGLLRRGRLLRETAAAIAEYGIKAPGPRAATRLLSGGNQQKLILARELGGQPTALVALQPTRGLDLGAARFVGQQLLERRAAGCAILLISTDLEELLTLSDRITVMFRGTLSPPQANDGSLDLTAIGLLMAGHAQEGSACSS